MEWRAGAEPRKISGCGEEAPFCVFWTHYPSLWCQRLHPGFTSAPVCRLLLHSVTAMPRTGIWGTLLGTNGAHCWECMMYNAPPVLLA